MNSESRQFISFDQFSDRIISIRCIGQGPDITIFQVYAPTTSYSADQVEDFYATLQSKIDAVAVPKRYYYHHGRLECQGRQRSWNMGTNHWEIWLQWDEQQRRTPVTLLQGKQPHSIQHSLQHKPSRKWTWTSPDHKSKNMIDLILIRDRWRCAVDNTRSFQSVDIGSDHSLVLA